jgi:L-ascorbate metabolism protein UlaG (beta-lactamase superfamily)
MAPWDEATFAGIAITAVPAQQGPDGTEHLTGPVTGFLLHGDDLPTVYVSGDNASLDVVVLCWQVRPPEVVPVHCDSWAHFTEGCDTAVGAFDRAGLADRLHHPRHGETITLP